MPAILLIEDDTATVRMLSLALELDGFEVEAAASRDDALKVVLTQEPDLIVMDYIMPGMDAESFIGELRRAGFGGKIVLCTGMDADLDLIVDAVLKKPFDPNQLSKLVATLISDAKLN